MDARVHDVSNEHSQPLLPIEGYEKFRLMTLEEAVQPLIGLFPPDSLKQRVSIAKERCQNPSDGLSQDESASIMLYTMSWPSTKGSFYSILNNTLRQEDRDSLKPWFPYLRLLIGALSRLPPVNDMIYRGVRIDMKDAYPPNSNKTWWGFSSCTDKMQLLQTAGFCGTTGTRTIFNIRCLHGRDIRKHSYFQTEHEILLLPGRYFQVRGSYQGKDGLLIIDLVEIKPQYELLKLPEHSPLCRFAPGLSLLGTCSNRQCNDYGKEVVIPIGLKNFDLLTGPDRSTSKCPMCEQYVNPSRLGFHRCQWRTYGTKQRPPQAPVKFSTDWKSTNNDFLFEGNPEEKDIIWREFKIEVKPI